MPELPEVETIARQLDKTIVGKRIRTIDVLSTKSFQGEADDLVGRTIKEVDRHGKMVVWHLDKPAWVVMIHLKMTGQLVWRPKLADTDNEQYQGKQVVGGHPSGDWNATLPNKHTRVEINFTDGSVLFFNDLRKFGWVRLVRLKDLIDLVNKMPPDVLDKRFTSEWLATALSKTSKAVKLVLMDQEKIGGIGNIYANDALNLAKTNPKRPAKSLKPDEIKKLHGAVKKVIDLGIKFGGASYSDYRDSRGQGGKYQEHFLVYGREGEKCKNCGHKLEKFQLGGRGTYWCPNCQV